MDGYDKNATNGFENPFVKPHSNELPTVDNSLATIAVKPFSWNVIKFGK